MHLYFFQKIVSNFNLQSLKFSELSFYFRLENCLSCINTKFAGQKPFSTFWYSNDFPIQTTFKLEIHLSPKKVKHCNDLLRIPLYFSFSLIITDSIKSMHFKRRERISSLKFSAPFSSFSWQVA